MVRCPADTGDAVTLTFSCEPLTLRSRRVRAGLAQNVQYERFTIPGAEGIHFNFFVRHAKRTLLQ